jgi:D-alanyl-D-alanine carboxypeptidase
LVERLRRLYVLLFGLGMRESSGRYCEGRDRSAHNTDADTAEAGLFQMSFDLVAPRAELLDVFHHYQSNPGEGLREIFELEMSPPPRPKDLENFGPSNSQGFAFQKLSKECPAMTVEIAALGLREEAGHWGPIINHAAEVRSASKELLVAVERIIDAPMTVATEDIAQPVAPVVMATGRSRADVARRYMQRVELAGLLPINKGLSSAKEETMISLLGAPHLPLTTVGQNDRASDLVKRNVVTERMSSLFRLQGLEPAIADLQSILAQAFAAERDLESVLSTEGMLSVRMRKPTDGSVSKKISNHAWGTAVDFKIVGFDAPANTGKTVPRFIAILIPLLNAAGWYSGVAFRDTMHFEVSEERIAQWSRDHVFK